MRDSERLSAQDPHRVLLSFNLRPQRRNVQFLFLFIRVVCVEGEESGKYFMQEVTQLNVNLDRGLLGFTQHLDTIFCWK